MPKQSSFTSTNPKMGGIPQYEKSGEVRKMSTVEKVVSYPARVAILGGLAAGTAADQALYNSGVVDKNNPRFSQTIREGKGYESAKKLARVAVGVDSIDKYEKGGVVKANPYRYANTEESGMEVYADKPGQKSRVVGGTQSKAGAGRGGQGGPTAKQLDDYEDKQTAGIFTVARMGKRLPKNNDMRKE